MPGVTGGRSKHYNQNQDLKRSDSTRGIHSAERIWIPGFPGVIQLKSNYTASYFIIIWFLGCCQWPI